MFSEEKLCEALSSQEDSLTSLYGMTLRELELTEVVRTVASLSERTHPPTATHFCGLTKRYLASSFSLFTFVVSQLLAAAAAAGRRKTISSSKISSRRPPPFRRRSAPLDPPMMASPVVRVLRPPVPSAK